MQCGGLQLFFFIKQERKLLSVKMNLFIQRNICENKNRNKIPCQMLEEFNGERYVTSATQSHIYKIKAVTLTSTDTHPENLKSP